MNMTKAEKEKFLEQRILTKEDIIRINKYNETPIPNIDFVKDSEYYAHMKKFTIPDDTKRTVGPNRIIILPGTILCDYFGKKKIEEIGKEIIDNEFLFWHSRRGLDTRMILIPVKTYDLLKKIGEPVQEFINYFDMKEDKIYLEHTNTNSYVIQGIPNNYRHPGRDIWFQAKDNIYINMEKKISKRK